MRCKREATVYSRPEADKDHEHSMIAPFRGPFLRSTLGRRSFQSKQQCNRYKGFFPATQLETLIITGPQPSLKIRPDSTTWNETGTYLVRRVNSTKKHLRRLWLFPGSLRGFPMKIPGKSREKCWRTFPKKRNALEL